MYNNKHTSATFKDNFTCTLDITCNWHVISSVDRLVIKIKGHLIPRYLKLYLYCKSFVSILSEYIVRFVFITSLNKTIL